MRRTAFGLGAFSCACAISVACGSSDDTTAPLDAGSDADISDSHADVSPIADASPPAPKIPHVIVIVMENHSFDTYFGRYCTAPAGSNPTCTTGPSCCEAAPDTDPNGVAPTTLDDAQNGGRDPDHTQACELSEMDDGGMDMYTMGPSCSDPGNFAVADPAGVAKPYL
ncbi:MAG: alkaline phosphatase family protein, partial [Polyangiaceae bacterium]